MQGRGRHGGWRAKRRLGERKDTQTLPLQDASGSRAVQLATPRNGERRNSHADSRTRRNTYTDTLSLIPPSCGGIDYRASLFMNKTESARARACLRAGVCVREKWRTNLQYNYC